MFVWEVYGYPAKSLCAGRNVIAFRSKGYPFWGAAEIGTSGRLDLHAGAGSDRGRQRCR